MTPDQLTSIVTDIVAQTAELVYRHVKLKNLVANYVCIFSHHDDEFKCLQTTAGFIGSIVKNTPTGPLFHITPINTIAGQVKLLKIRQPDPARPERGDTDFTVFNYSAFKQQYLSQPGFSLITRPEMEMIELMETGANVRAYFSFPPLDQQLGIK